MLLANDDPPDAWLVPVLVELNVSEPHATQAAEFLREDLFKATNGKLRVALQDGVKRTAMLMLAVVEKGRDRLTHVEFGLEVHSR